MSDRTNGEELLGEIALPKDHYYHDSGIKLKATAYTWAGATYRLSIGFIDDCRPCLAQSEVNLLRELVGLILPRVAKMTGRKIRVQVMRMTMCVVAIEALRPLLSFPAIGEVEFLICPFYTYTLARHIKPQPWFVGGSTDYRLVPIEPEDAEFESPRTIDALLAMVNSWEVPKKRVSFMHCKMGTRHLVTEFLRNVKGIRALNFDFKRLSGENFMTPTMALLAMTIVRSNDTIRYFNISEIAYDRFTYPRLELDKIEKAAKELREYKQQLSVGMGILAIFEPPRRFLIRWKHHPLRLLQCDGDHAIAFRVKDFLGR